MLVMIVSNKANNLLVDKVMWISSHTHAFAHTLKFDEFPCDVLSRIVHINCANFFSSILSYCAAVVDLLFEICFSLALGL